MLTNEHIHKTEGKNNECYTPDYGVFPLLPYMERFRDKIIWCPCDKEDSEFVKIFRKEGFKVVYSHIDYGQDFYFYEPEQWDVLITNPPFQGKKTIVERALSFGKPFALLLPVTWLNDSTPIDVFQGIDMQLLLFRERMQFKNQPTGKISYKCVYYCHDFLPKQTIFSDFSNRKQLRMEIAK